MAEILSLASVTYKQGAYIIVEGKPSTDQFFIIQKGKVRVSRAVEVVTELRGNILGPGELFGVVSAMASHSCIESVMALSDVVLISIKKDQYGDFIRRNTPVAIKIIQQFSQRLRYLDDALGRRGANDGDNTASSMPAAAEYYVRLRRYNHAFYIYHRFLKQNPQDDQVRKIKEQMMKIAPHVTELKPVRGLNDTEWIYPKDSMFFAEGEKGDELYIIKKGSVKICRIVEHQEVVLAVLKAGDIFGEMALLENKPRMAAAVAYEECTVMAVNRSNFAELITAQSQLIARLTSLLAERIWTIYKQLANGLIASSLGRIYDALLIQLEKDRVDINTNQSHLCNFGIQELTGMAGLPQEESDQLLKRLIMTKRIKLDGDKIHVMDASEVLRQTEYYRRAQKQGLRRVE